MAALGALGTPSIVAVSARVDDTDANSSYCRLPHRLRSARKLCRNMGARTVLGKPMWTIPPTLCFPAGPLPLHFPPPAQSLSRLPRTVSSRGWNISKDRDSNTAIISKDHPAKQGAGAVLTRADLAGVSRNATQLAMFCRTNPWTLTFILIIYRPVTGKNKSNHALRG